MDKRLFKDKVYSILADMIRALANPHRLEIVDLLGQGEKSVDAIASESNISIANASQHLQVLKANNLVTIRRQGNFVYYSLSHVEIYKSFQMMRKLGLEHIAEMEKIVKDFRVQRNSQEALGIDELLTRMGSNKVVLLDVRPIDEFRNGHIPGSINIPLAHLAEKLTRFSKHKEYIVYCRGPFCVFADEAVKLLTQKGFKARRLEEGFPDWKIKGLPVSAVVEN
jgi:rhodanese-related sulfurtransferase/predicted transcriptional regulator